MVVLCTLVAPTVSQSIAAQQRDSLLVHRGTWGAELAPISTGGALLLFTSPGSALIAGVDFSTAHDDRPTAPGTFTRGSVTSNLRAQLGLRWYLGTSGDTGRRLRPIVGLGAVSTRTWFDFGDDFDRQWTAGGYGEVGATWFFSPHFSLGAVSMVQATKGRERQVVTTFPVGMPAVRTTQTTNVWSVSANLARVLAAVYF
jgi:hypothetical protein